MATKRVAAWSRSRNTVPLATVVGVAMRMLSTFAVGLLLGKWEYEGRPFRQPVNSSGKRKEPVTCWPSRNQTPALRQAAAPCTPTRRRRGRLALAEAAAERTGPRYHGGSPILPLAAPPITTNSSPAWRARG